MGVKMGVVLGDGVDWEAWNSLNEGNAAISWAIPLTTRLKLCILSFSYSMIGNNCKLVTLVVVWSGVSPGIGFGSIPAKL